MLAGAIYAYQSVRTFVAAASVAQGTVGELVASHSSDSTTYRPTVRFTTADGRSIEFTSGVSTNPPVYSRGDQVEVLYHIQAETVTVFIEPANPSRYLVDVSFLPKIAG
jgi:Protein of unknown function (DUF3592)